MEPQQPVLTEEEREVITRRRLEKQHGEYSYLYLMRDILDKGVIKSNRTGIDTRSVFGYPFSV